MAKQNACCTTRQGKHHTKSSTHVVPVMLQSKAQCSNILETPGEGNAARPAHRRTSRVTAQTSNPRATHANTADVCKQVGSNKLAFSHLRHNCCTAAAFIAPALPATTSCKRYTAASKQHTAASNILSTTCTTCSCTAGFQLCGLFHHRNKANTRIPWSCVAHHRACTTHLPLPPTRR